MRETLTGSPENPISPGGPGRPTGPCNRIDNHTRLFILSNIHVAVL